MDEKGQGWLLFAAVVLGVAGIMRVFDAIWAFRYHGALPQNFEDAIFGHSLKTYGWVYLIVAIVLILCAFGVLARSQFSRWIGMFAGAILAIERDLVDALLPRVVSHIHLGRRPCYLRTCRLRRSGSDDIVPRLTRMANVEIAGSFPQAFTRLVHRPCTDLGRQLDGRSGDIARSRRSPSPWVEGVEGLSHG